jgi:lysophospholipase L1-like esterase
MIPGLSHWPHGSPVVGDPATSVQFMQELTAWVERGRAPSDKVLPVTAKTTPPIQRVHTLRLPIYGATLTPTGFTDDREAERLAVNGWIRTGGRFDAVVDFDAVVRDPARPAFPLPTDDSGDHVHFNVAGYRVLANSINLSLFRSRGVDR